MSLSSLVPILLTPSTEIPEIPEAFNENVLNAEVVNDEISISEAYLVVPKLL